MTTFDLRGRTALVTGGFSGLGLHFARVLVDHGARVAQIGQRIGLGRELADLGGPLLLLAADASAYMTGAVIAVDGGHLVSSL